MLDNPSALEVVGIIWLLIGLVLSWLMGRRGHSAFVWLVLGALLGPLGIVLAWDSHRRDEVLQPVPLAGAGAGNGTPATATTPNTATAPGPATVSVLVGYDGSAASQHAVEAVVALLGERLGRLEVASVAPFGGIGSDERWARGTLLQLRTQAQDRVTSRVVLHGRPATALCQRADEANFDLIAIGASRAVFDGVAGELARGCPLPVLIAGPEGDA